MTEEENDIKKYNMTHYSMTNGFKEVICIRNSIEEIIALQEDYRRQFEGTKVTENTEYEKLIFFPTAQVLYNNLLNISVFYEQVLRAQLMEEELIEDTYLEDHLLSFEGMSEYVISKQDRYYNLKMMVGMKVHIKSEIEFPPVFAKKRIVYPSEGDYEYDPDGLIADDEFSTGVDELKKTPRFLSDTVRFRDRKRKFTRNRPMGFEHKRYI